MLTYNRHNPFLASVKKRYVLSQSGSSKNTQHVILDLTASRIQYEVGDCIGVLPNNPPSYVESVLDSFKTQGNENIESRHSSKPVTFKVLLEKYLNLSSIPKKLVEVASEYYPQLIPLLQQENRAELKTFLSEREVWDFLKEFYIPSLSVEHFVSLLQPLLPRFYSIASHQPTVGEEVHLTVAHIHYSSFGYERWGICTHYLCHLASINEWSVPIYLQPHKGFTLPDNPAANIIMIGPGTGIAPYVGFMQKRLFRGDTGRNWLFFGECNEKSDFFYESFWKTLEVEGKLKVSTAFSRDQPQKIYVQHRMLEQAEELFQWIEEGATIFVCGNADYMAKDVESTLIHILQEEGKLSYESSIQYLKDLRHQKRYLKDVY